MRATNFAIILAVTITLSGCERINIKRSIKLDPAQAHSVFIDAKQRAVTYVPVPTVTTTLSRVGETQTSVTTSTTQFRVCAEPSPDALTAITTAARANANIEGKVDVAAAFSRAEAAASIGLRTQSITLMRDVLFRICEQYQSGALTPAAVETLERRYQSSMVAILAIEQLTGVVRAPPVLLDGSASNSGADAVAKILAEKQKANATDVAAKSALAGASATAETAAKDVTTFEAANDEAARTGDKMADYDALIKKRDDAQADQAAKETEATAAAAALKDASAAMAAVGGGNGSAVAGGLIGASGEPARLRQGDVERIASAVENIVDNAMTMGFLRESCATLLVAAIEGRSAIMTASAGGVADGFADTCNAYFKATVAGVTADNERDAAITGLISNASTAAEIEAIVKLIALNNGSNPQNPNDNSNGAKAAAVVKQPVLRDRGHRAPAAVPSNR